MCLWRRCLEYALAADEVFGILMGWTRVSVGTSSAGARGRPGRKVVQEAPHDSGAEAPAGQDRRRRPVVEVQDHPAVIRDVMRARLEREVDPVGTLPPAERAKQAAEWCTESGTPYGRPPGK